MTVALCLHHTGSERNEMESTEPAAAEITAAHFLSIVGIEIDGGAMSEPQRMLTDRSDM